MAPWPHFSVSAPTEQITAVSDPLNYQEWERDPETNQIKTRGLIRANFDVRAIFLITSVTPRKTCFFQKNVLIRFSYPC